MANTYLTRTPSSAGNRKTWTWSAWIKRSTLGTEQFVFYGYDSSGNDTRIFFNTDDTLRITNDISNVNNTRLYTTQVFRDTSAWYHIVIVADTDNGTSSNRFKFYINGTLVTSFSTATYPSSGVQTHINNNILHTLGRRSDGASNYFDGSMSHIHFIDGTAYDASAFGETDATTGEWKIKTSPSVTYGTNGFFILKDGNSVTDQSGNGNNFTVAGGTLTKTEDSPSNVFATLNALDKHSSLTPSNGNLTVSNGAGTWMPIKSTLGMSSGKWYCEAKITSGTDFPIGIYLSSTDGGSQSAMDNSRVAYNTTATSGTIFAQGVFSYSESSVGTSGTGDIIGMALDCDNGTMKFFKNGTQLGSTVTNSVISSNEWMFGVQLNGDGVQYNFGNGYFGTTAVSSAGTNASGIGIFEYDVPTGYTALSTKGLNL